MRICILTSTHKVYDGRIFYKEAVSLVKKGHSVALIAPLEERTKDYIDQGIRVFGVRKRKKIFHMFTLMDIFKIASKIDCDVYYCHEPDSLFVGMILKYLNSNKLIYDVHEHWPSEIRFGWLRINTDYLNNSIEKIISCFETIVSNTADRIIAVSESVAIRFDRYKVSILMNTPSIERFKKMNTNVMEKHADTNPSNVNIIYMGGSLKSFHGLNECFDAFHKLRNIYNNITLTIIGEIDAEVKDNLKKYPMDGIRITGYLPYDQMYQEIYKGTIGLLIFKPEYYNIKIGLPNKLFDYMMCGLPVVASDFPEIRKVINESECGILVDPTNVEDIKNAMKRLIENPIESRKMGENGQHSVRIRYNWEAMEKILIGIFKELS